VKRFGLAMPVLVVVSFLFPVLCLAQDEGTFSGAVSITGRIVDGERESAKFQEYREIPEGVSGSIELKHQRKDGYYLDLKASDIAEDDQYTNLRIGKYGKYRIEIVYDQIPHRFAFDALTLYGGIGSGNLTLSPRLQSDLQGSTSANDLAARTKSALTGAPQVDLELMRKIGKVNIDVMAFDPLNLRIELSREERRGARPFFGSFGFGNAIEIAEPIDYDTTEVKLIAEYSQRPLLLNATYTLSIFKNNIDTVTWANPFRAVDSTNATAYTATFAAGPSRGLIDLYPDNISNNLSLTGSWSDLPFRTRISATASWAWQRQDDDLVPYTTNTAIKVGAESGVAGVPVPINAFDPSALPASHVDAKNNVSLYNLGLTSRPLDFMNVKARYRYYESDKKTDIVEFPGHVRFDAVWEPEHEANVPNSYKKHTAGVDVGLDVARVTNLGVGYTFEKIKRTNREVEDQEDNTVKVSVDNRSLAWLDLKASYERSTRRGKYDFETPFLATHLGEEGEGPVPQLPSLRKYDQANRDRDRIRLLATVYPLDPLSVTGSVVFGKDKFDSSDFGLLDDKHQIYSLDVDYAVSQWLNLFAFYSFEKYTNTQKARQWTPDAIGDPFTRETGVESNSNWTAENEDKLNTFGAGVDFAIIPKKLGLKLTYSYSKTDGKIKLASPLGTSANDNNAFTPLDFTEVDDVTLHRLDARLKYQINKNLAVAVGYMWEKFDIRDFNLEGFTNVPTTTTGAYNGALLMGTLPKDYDANVVYTKLVYTF